MMRITGRLSAPHGPLTAARPLGISPAVMAFSVMFASICAASLLGVLSRPVGQLASIWPANAIMVGLMLRFPVLSSPAGWIGGAFGYLFGDFVTGDDWMKTVTLTASNLFAVAVSMPMLSRLDVGDRSLRRPMSVLKLACGAAATATAAGVAGSFVGPFLFGQPWEQSMLLWFAGELLAFVTVLPVVLTLRPSAWLAPLALKRQRRRADREQVAPILALLTSVAVALLMPGQSAFAIPVAALLWCGLTYSIGTTAVLTALYSYTSLVAVATGLLSMQIDYGDPLATLPLRITIALLSLAPVTVAVVMAGRNDLLVQLRHMADHDPLTGILNRRAFAEQAAAQWSASAPSSKGIAFLMIDIDHFKQVNEQFGHTGGDEVLKGFAQVARDTLRTQELIARMGGEEFAILLPDCRTADAIRAVDRLREGFATWQTTCSLRTTTGEAPSITFSVGIATTPAATASIDALHRDADQALYRAKHEGRNRTICTTVGQ